MAQGRRPVGILAALIAAVIAVAGLKAGQAYALRLAEGDLARIAGPALPIKFETLTFQRAAYATADALPIYGSSELFCCGQPDLPTQFFAHAPAGFQPFAIGRAGTGDLMFLETFGALGPAVRGKHLVVSVSPQWFFGRAGITAGYDGNFSPEIAETFVYDAPLPLALKEAAARQMAAHPQTLRGQGLLRLGVQALAAGNVAAYYALLPLGRLDAWAQQLKDAWQTIEFIRAGNRVPSSAPAARPSSSPSTSPSSQPSSPPASPPSTSPSAPVVQLAVQSRAGRSAAAPTSSGAVRSQRSGQNLGHAAGQTAPTSSGAVRSQPAPPPVRARNLELAALTRQASGPVRPGAIDWTAKLRAASAIEDLLGGSDPFGFYLNPKSLPQIAPALRLYCRGKSNATGGVYPFPAAWASNMRASAEWTDLGLELQALHDLGAQALVWTLPLQGYYDNYTQLSAPARRVYYDRFVQVTAGSGFPAVDYGQLDTDRLAMANTGGHFSPRGWVMADRVLDLFWHGQAAAIPGTLGAMLRAVPSPAPAAPAACPSPTSGGNGSGSASVGG
jgi:poly-D-alanine transfer protein DltD